MPIYTRMGDSGLTTILKGLRLSKNHQILEALGELDELEAQIGVVRAIIKDNEISSILKKIQSVIKRINVEIQARYVGEIEGYHEYIIKDSDVLEIEEYIDKYESKLPKLRKLIIYGGAYEASLMYYLRAVCRRVERRLVELTQIYSRKYVNNKIIPYVNRLSDLFYILGRYLNQKYGVSEEIWRM